MRIRSNAMNGIRFYLPAIVLLSVSTIIADVGYSGAAALPRYDSQEMNFTLEGKINKQSPGKLTISGEGNIIFHVAYNDKTEIKQKDGGSASAKDLRVGMTVRVEGDLTESGEVIAHKIEIQSEGASK